MMYIDVRICKKNLERHLKQVEKGIKTQMVVLRQELYLQLEIWFILSV